MVFALVNLPQGSVLGTYRLKDLKIKGTDNREALPNVTCCPQALYRLIKDLRIEGPDIDEALFNVTCPPQSQALFNDTRSPQALFNDTLDWRSPQVCMEGNTAETGLFDSESQPDSGELTWQYSVVETSVLSDEMPALARIF